MREIFHKFARMSSSQLMILVALLLVLSFTGFQIFRTVQRASYWRQHRDEPIAGWMRAGFVANSYKVPIRVVNQAIGLPADARDRRPLTEIAKMQNRSFEEIKADLERAINDFRTIREPSPRGGP